MDLYGIVKVISFNTYNLPVYEIVTKVIVVKELLLN